MGYWDSDEEGNSFTGNLVWGDAPADIMDDAISLIVKVFEQDVGRKPTAVELLAGFRFSWNAYGEGE